MALNINGTTGISGVDGSASAPALQGSDSNTGVSFGTDTVNINTGGSTKVTVDSSGNLGVGETSPLGKLHVKTADSGATAEVSADELVVEGSGHSGISVLSGTGNAGTINFGDSGDNDIGRIIYNHNGNVMSFNTNALERARITSAGNIYLRTTEKPSSSVAGLGIEAESYGRMVVYSASSSTSISYLHFFGNPNGFIGSISVSGSSASFSTSSDYRLKENIVAISDGITRLKTLQPKRFNFITDETNTLVDGFLAHEVTAVPEAITGAKDEVDSDNNPIYQGIDQSKLVPLLTAALQEAIAKIEVLETKVAALEAA